MAEGGEAAVAVAELRLCGKPCGVFVVNARDGVFYDPPLIEPATCRLDPSHEEACCP